MFNVHGVYASLIQFLQLLMLKLLILLCLFLYFIFCFVKHMKLTSNEMCYKSSIAIKVVAAVDPNKVKTDINCFSSCTPGKLVLTESSLHARSISGGSNIIRHRPCPKSLQFNWFRRNVGHHRNPPPNPPPAQIQLTSLR